VLIQEKVDGREVQMQESVHLRIVADRRATETAATANLANLVAAAATLGQQQSFDDSGRQQGGEDNRAPFNGQQQQQQQQQQLSTKVTAAPLTQTRTSSPLPWRALHHLGPDYSAGVVNASSSQAPAYLVSAFLDIRPTMHGQQENIAVVMAIDKHTKPTSWKCLLQLDSPSVAPQVSDLSIMYSVRNNEAFFKYQASTGYCEIPQALQTMLQQNSSLHDGKTMKGLTLTVFKDNEDSGSFIAALLQKQHIWVPVVPLPPLALLQQQRYLSGEGSIAVCTPPVHTDAYAATLVGWQAFHKQMGVQQVIMYSFNPGPLIKPLMDFYAQQGFVQVHEWIIPASILERKQQPCLLPFFHASEARARFDSPPCTYHQVGVVQQRRAMSGWLIDFC
jgi:hypothetical protein